MDRSGPAPGSGPGASFPPSLGSTPDAPRAPHARWPRAGWAGGRRRPRWARSHRRSDWTPAGPCALRGHRSRAACCHAELAAGSAGSSHSVLVRPTIRREGGHQRHDAGPQSSGKIWTAMTLAHRQLANFVTSAGAELRHSGRSGRSQRNAPWPVVEAEPHMHSAHCAAMPDSVSVTLRRRR